MGLQFLAKYREGGLLLLRASLGLLLVIWTAPMLMGGPARWKQFGSGLRHIGFQGNYEVWGMIGITITCLAGVLMVFGLWFRAAVLAAIFIAAIYASGVWSSDPPLRVLLPPLELCLVLLSLLFIGPGKYSVDKN